MSNCILHLLKRKITVKSELKRASSQPVLKKDAETMEGMHGIFVLYTDTEVS